MRQRLRDDEGSIVLALMAIMVLMAITTAGLGQLVLEQHFTQRDKSYEQALTTAETGLDKLQTQVRANPMAASFAPVTGTSGTATYSATATGTPGHWVLTSVGHQSTVTRTISEKVDIADLLQRPLFADTALTLGGTAAASGADRYDSAVSSLVCAPDGTPQSMGYSVARMCSTASPALGAIGTNGPLTMVGASLANVSTADIFASGVAGYPDPADTGRCAGDATTCAAVGGAVQLHEDRLDFPVSSLCANGVGAGASAYDGSLALAANTVYSFTNVTLNATAIANLSNLSGSTLVVCFSGQLDVVPGVPLNSTIATALPLRLAPRPPSTLVLISTAGSPKVRFNAGLTLPSSLSAVVYAPNATCTATAHVDVYGAVVCGSLNASQGMNVHYDVQVGSMPFDQPVTVSTWREL